MKRMIKGENEITTGVKESDMPFRYYHFDYSDGFSGFQFHWHEEIEIHRIVSGSGSFFIDDNEYPVEIGDIIFIAPRIIHSGKSEENNLVDICYIVDCEYLMSKNSEHNTDKYFAELASAKIDNPIINKEDSGYTELLASLNNIDRCAVEKGTVYQLEIKRSLYDFFIELFKHGYLSVTNDTEFYNDTKSIIKQSISYIQKNASSKLTVDKIASYVGLSSSYFMKLFKDNTKMTCIEYIKLLRLNNATNMLKETDDSILQIAHSCGFSNLSLFNREFKKYFSLTPSMYRKKYKQSEINLITL